MKESVKFAQYQALRDFDVFVKSTFGSWCFICKWAQSRVKDYIYFYNNHRPQRKL